MQAKQSVAEVIAAAVVRNSKPHCGDGPTGGTLLDLLTRLYDDHQCAYPHHAHLCPLCIATNEAIEHEARRLIEEKQ